MKFLMNFSAFLLLIGGFTNHVVAQENTQLNKEQKSTFNKYEAFSPLFMTDQVNGFHSATGNPGSEYWQNRANYKIKATLDTIHQKIDGSVTIKYINNSPYNLEFLWLQLDQNTFKKESRGSALYPANDRNGVHTYTNGYELKNVAIKMDRGSKQKADYIVSDSRLQIRLPETLKAKGKDMEITINYSFDIPEHGKDRMGRVLTKNGWIYTLAQWYPRMEVMDEVDGWNTLPYLGTGEFYLDYGDFDYEITAPADMIVVGSGLLQNPKEVLTQYEQKQLEKAQKSDKTVSIQSVKQMLDRADHHKADKNGMLTWHFKIEQSRDISWAASNAFIWDAAKINLPKGKTALAQSLYPVENSGIDGYGRSTEYIKNSIELYSNKWFSYTYPVATNVGAHEGGMEYPGIVFCNYKSKGENLWGVINHEFGHNWFPMVVGSNERKFAWMDEGFNTFINDVDTKEFNNGEYYHTADLQSMGIRLFNEQLDPVFTVPDVIHNQGNLGVEAYYKPSTALQILRNTVLGQDRFDYAFKTYIKRWAFKHPTPWDFFNTMNSAAGEDLTWFWKGWFMNNWKLDQAVEGVKYVKGDPKNGALITLLNKNKMAMPVTLKITEANNTTKTVKLPVEVWMTGPEYVYNYESTTKIISVEIDPNHEVPDLNPANNTLTVLLDAPAGITAKSVINNYIQTIGGQNKLANVKDIATSMNTNIQGTAIKIETMKKDSNKYFMSISIPASNQVFVKYVVNGDQVSAMSNGVVQPLDTKQKQVILKEVVIFPELEYVQKGYKTELLGVQVTNGEQLYVVKITSPNGDVSKNYYNVTSGLKYKHEALGKTGNSITEYADYKTVDGIKIPFTQTSNNFGQNIEMKITEIKINKGIADSNFK
ncbi:M1 family aminopeptidase [Polaribacter sp. Q13]|uniref:M1 family aminopeptidase n=1 Tax=Polaribacter sp. Q13 TaxID=2806551 RepID=UPI002078BF58|nr:M1 family aminopeptidase [Polaribacter sp. Q13]